MTHLDVRDFQNRFAELYRDIADASKGQDLPPEASQLFGALNDVIYEFSALRIKLREEANKTFDQITDA